MKLFTSLGSFVMAGIFLTSCVTRGEIEEIKESQKKILAKLDDMAKSRGPAAPQRPSGPAPEKTYAIPIESAHAKGSKDAWITIIVVSDFQCPFCKRVTPTLKEVEGKYGSDVRTVFIHNPLPFHNRAMPTAMAAECSGEQGKFWQMHDAMFETQQELEDNHLEGYAKKIGVDVGKWKSCYTSNKFKSKIEDQQKLANQFGARGTPAFFINGRFLSGAQPFPAFDALVEEELKKAKASGVSKKDYYTKQVLEKGEKNI